MVEVEYTFTEFKDDFLTFLDTVEAEAHAFEAADGTLRPIGFEEHSFRLVSFVRSREPEQSRHFVKMYAIMFVHQFILEHADELDVKTHLIKSNSFLTISDTLIEAIFLKYVPDGTFSGPKDVPSAEEVLQLADELARK